MSDFSSYRYHSQRFLSAHPLIEGWKIYEYAGDEGLRLHLYYLIDFLRDRYPEAIKERTTYGVVDGPALLGEHGQPTYLQPEEKLEVEQEFRCDLWLGSVRIVWQDHEMHFLAFPMLVESDGFRHFHFLATKSNVTLQRFLQELDQYGQTRQRQDAHTIYVVNGKDIPIAPASWDDVILPPGVAEDICANATAFLEGQERYAQLAIPHRRGFLFSGPPGCGKTLTLRILTHTLAAKFVTVLGRANVNDEHIQHAFSVAAKHVPAVILFEDLDKLIDAAGISLSHFLNMLDGLHVTKGVLVIATSNEPERLDSALLHRPSRFDRIWTFPLPTLDLRLALLCKLGRAYFSESALQEAAQKSHGFSMAYVQEIVVSALVESAHNGTAPSDWNLFRSLDTLRAQRKSASKEVDSLAEQDNVGFALPTAVSLIHPERSSGSRAIKR
jgi:hypothetical protein